MPTPHYQGPYHKELTVALDALHNATIAILTFYDAQSAETYIKGDGSPVTDADLASDRIIRETISASFPNDALLTEEGAKSYERLSHSRCWIVDPIDGTAQYVARTGLFDVMIALTIDGRPVVAATVNPVSNRFQYAVVGQGAWEVIDGVESRFHITDPQTPPRIATHDPPRVVSSKWYGGFEQERGSGVQRIARRLGAIEPPILEVGYQSRNFSDTERTFDAFVGLPQGDRGSIAQEWDLACVDLITHEAGGVLTDCWGRLHRYNKKSTNISGGILASASPDLHARLVAAVAPELPADMPAPDPAEDGVLG